jgi:hypothetical protein
MVIIADHVPVSLQALAFFKLTDEFFSDDVLSV